MEFILTLNEHDIDIVSTALVELPYRVVAPLILKINSQISEQSRENEKEEKPKESFEPNI